MKHIFGKKINEKNTIGIKELRKRYDSDSNEEVVIKGELFAVDSRIVGKNRDKWLYSGVIGDEESEVLFQLFTFIKHHPDGLDIKDGDMVVMSGNPVSNKFTQNELSLNVKALAKVEKVPEKENVKKEERVELQTFTQYSKMRSGLKVKELFEKAKELGMSHIAITDVNSIQAFPSAYKLSKEYGVNLIYGATLLLAPDDTETVYGPIPKKKLEDATYVAFDVETTGFSASSDEVYTDHIIEIGAVKFFKGEVVDSFQCFVKSPKPIPKHITELTGITQEQVDTYGIPLDEAVEKFDVFTKGSILVAHNATFDRDHMLEAYRRVNKEMPAWTIVDTLELDRLVSPEARSHRLDSVCRRYIKAAEEKRKQHNKKLREEKSNLKKMIQETGKLERLIKNDRANEEQMARLNELNNEIEKTHELLKELEEKINQFSKKMENLHLENHHRANEDAEVTGHVFFEMLRDLKARGITTFESMTQMSKDSWKYGFPKEITLLAQNKTGLKNLMRILSKAHTTYLTNQPTITKDAINQHREGILVGSGSHDGPLFELVANKPIHQAEKEIEFYDFIEIQPPEISAHLVAENKIDSLEYIQSVWRRIYQLAKQKNKPVVATGHVHYVNDNENDIIVHNVLLYHQLAGLEVEKRKGRKGAIRKGRHLKSSDDLMREFPYLTDEEKKEVIIDNPRKIAESCEAFSPLPKGLYPPKVKGGDEKLRKIAFENAEKQYGKPLPEIVEKRLQTELDSIISNGFAVVYLISRDLVKNSEKNGYLVGSRGSVGSSFVATMAGITEVNPLKPHYYSSKTNWSVFFDHPEAGSGFDLPESLSDLFTERYSKDAKVHFLKKLVESFNYEFNEENIKKVLELCKNHQPNTCPITGEENALKRDGQDIPFETFLGFDGDKVPDIDLNFSGEFQATSHKFVEEMFGKDKTFRAGTIGTVASKTAFGYLASYSEENNLGWSRAKIMRLTGKIQGAKRTTGQHPGGILVVPENMEPEDFTPIQHPAESRENSHIRTSHFDYGAIEDNVLKLDILGHDDPTILKMLHDLTGVDPKKVPVNDKKVLGLFGGDEDVKDSLGISLDKITAKTGTLAVPEFGTDFVQQMIVETKPSSFAELVKISGLSHGTDVWLGNAQELIKEGVCTLNDVIDTRDNIMVYLMQKGLDSHLAFTIMESVRKGKGLILEWIEEMKKHGVPDWYIDSCQKIKYMFPKAHAAAYVLSALRVAYYKVYHPTAFYSVVLSVRYNKADWTELNKEPEELWNRIQELQEEISYLESINEKNKAKNLKDLLNPMEIILEAKRRGIKFENLNIEISEPTTYTVKDGKIYPPFTSIPGVGEEAAISVGEARKQGRFKNVNDILKRTSLSKTVIAKLKNLGVLDDYIDIQHTLF